jgi:hypothetical protein
MELLPLSSNVPDEWLPRPVPVVLEDFEIPFQSLQLQLHSSIFSVEVRTAPTFGFQALHICESPPEVTINDLSSSVVCQPIKEATVIRQSGFVCHPDPKFEGHQSYLLREEDQEVVLWIKAHQYQHQYQYQCQSHCHTPRALRDFASDLETKHKMVPIAFMKSWWSNFDD